MHFDTILKSILESLGNCLTLELTGSKPLELINQEFASMERRLPDMVWRLSDGRIFHLEIQSTNDSRMPQRMLHYWLLLHERFPKASIVQHVLYIGGPALSMTRRIDADGVSYRYELTDIRDIDEEVFLTSESAPDRVLAVLSRMRNARVTIRRILASWADASWDERENVIQKLMVLSGLRRLDGIVAEEVQNMPIMIDVMENETIRGWIERGLAQGRREGIDQGIDLGRASLLGKLLTKRFGKLPLWAEEKLRLADSDQQERWAMRIIIAVTLEEVFSE